MPLHRPSLGVIFLTIVIDLLGFGLVMPFLALQGREAFGLSAANATLLGTCYSAMQFFFMPLWGSLSDRIGRRPVMLTSIFFSSVTMAGLGFALGFAESSLWLFAARAASGMATANIGTASAYIADITTPEERVKGMGLIGMAFGIGFVVGPGVGGLLAAIEINGRQGPVACFAAAGLSLVNLLWALYALPESLPPERRSTGDAPARRMPWRFDALARTLRTPGISRAALANFLIILAFSGLEITYALYVTDLFALTQKQVGLMFVFMGFLGAAIQGGFMRRASGRYRETSLAFTGLALQALGFLGFLAAPQLGLWALFVTSGLVAVGNGFTQPSLSAYISRLSSPARQGEALSSNHSLASLGRVFGPLMAGQLYNISPLIPFLGGAMANALAWLLALRMRRLQPSVTQPPPGTEAIR